MKTKKEAKKEEMNGSVTLCDSERGAERKEESETK